MREENGWIGHREKRDWDNIWPIMSKVNHHQYGTLSATYLVLFRSDCFQIYSSNAITNAILRGNIVESPIFVGQVKTITVYGRKLHIYDSQNSIIARFCNKAISLNPWLRFSITLYKPR